MARGGQPWCAQRCAEAVRQLRSPCVTMPLFHGSPPPTRTQPPSCTVMPATPASDYDPDRPARSPRNAQRGLLRCDVRALSDIDVAKAVFDAVRARDLDALLRVYSDDIVIRDDPRLPYGGEYQGRDRAIRHPAGFAGTWDPPQSPRDRDPAEGLLDAGTPIVAVWPLKAPPRHHRPDQTTGSPLNF